MKIHAAAVCVALLLAGSAVQAQTSSGSGTMVVTTDPVTGKKTTRPATDAERAQARAALESVRPTLESPNGLETSLAALENLDAQLGSLKGLTEEIARLEQMVATETPISTTTRGDVTVRVYRDGTTVTDKGDNRKYDRGHVPLRN